MNARFPLVALFLVASACRLFRSTPHAAPTGPAAVHVFRNGAGVVEIGVGDAHACARTSDGRVFCWGDNALGQIARRTYGDDDPGRTRVSPFLSMSGATELSVGAVASCVVRIDGIRCWGSTVTRALAASEASFGPSAVDALRGPLGIAHIASGGGSYCAFGRGLMCWGENEYGATGQAPSLSSRGIGGPVDTTPVVITGPSPLEVAIGSEHACEVLADRTVRCWGKGTQGQLGDGQVEHHADARAVPGLPPIVQIVAASQHTCALAHDGEVYCWGRNEFGELGAGDAPMRESGFGSSRYRYSASPLRVQGLPPAMRIAAGGSHGCAIMTNGTAQCWGRNQVGQLGDGTLSPRTAPVEVVGLRDVVQVACSTSFGEASTCALTRDGAVWCWGSNESGQRGDASPTPSGRPVRVPLRITYPDAPN